MLLRLNGLLGCCLSVGCLRYKVIIMVMRLLPVGDGYRVHDDPTRPPDMGEKWGPARSHRGKDDLAVLTCCKLAIIPLTSNGRPHVNQHVVSTLRLSC